MLRVGLTGGLGSGKSAVALVFREMGAHILEADAIGRALMQPGEQVYGQIVAHFGSEVLTPQGGLDRRALARLAFEGGRLAELSRIVQPAVITEQEREIEALAKSDPNGITVVESALIFEVSADEVSAGTGVPSWRERFDRLVLVSAPETLKVARYVERVVGAHSSVQQQEQAAADARRRLALQLPDSEKIQRVDFLIENDRSLVLLRRRAQDVYRELARCQPMAARNALR